MSNRNEKKQLFHITSVWFLVALACVFVEEITKLLTATAWDAEVLITQTIVLSVFTFFSPTKKFSTVFISILTAIYSMSGLGYLTLWGIESTSLAEKLTALFQLTNAMALVSLAVFSTAQFSKKPKRKLKLRYMPVIFASLSSCIAIIIYIIAFGWYVLYPYPYLLCFLVHSIGAVSYTIALYQLSMQFHIAGYEKLQALEAANNETKTDIESAEDGSSTPLSTDF